MSKKFLLTSICNLAVLGSIHPALAEKSCATLLEDCISGACTSWKDPLAPYKKNRGEMACKGLNDVANTGPVEIREATLLGLCGVLVADLKSEKNKSCQ